MGPHNEHFKTAVNAVSSFQKMTERWDKKDPNSRVDAENCVDRLTWRDAHQMAFKQIFSK